MANPGQTPTAIVGVDVDEEGFTKAAGSLSGLSSVFDKIEGGVGRIGSTLDGWGDSLTKLAGLGSLAYVADQFARIEQSAAGVAGLMNQVTGGSSGYTGLANQFAKVQAATGVGYGDQSQALTQLNSITGLQGLANNPQVTMLLLMGLATFSQAYGLTMPQVAQAGGSLAAAIGLGPTAANGLLGTVAAQAAQAGLAGQTGQMVQTAAALASGASASAPYFSAQPGSQTDMLASAFATALRSQGPQWTPSAIASAYGGLNSGLQSAPSNPSLEAFMNMAGVSVQSQFAGLTGPNAAQTLQRIATQANREYGKGSTTEDLFFDFELRRRRHERDSRIRARWDAGATARTAPVGSREVRAGRAGEAPRRAVRDQPGDGHIEGAGEGAGGCHQSACRQCADRC